jgi:protease-4
MQRLAVFLIFTILFTGCAGPSIKLVSDASDPLREFTLEGTSGGKILIVPIRGVISDNPRKGFFRVLPSMVQKVVAHLRKAEKDPDIKAVILKINSPGGSATASDILYQEINAYKQRSGVKIVAAMMGLAASGGYYVALPADTIVAHPTTVTGSVGAVFIKPEVSGLMEKIGVDVTVHKSGRNKDMGSPFRTPSKEEEGILQALIDSLGKRFTGLVAQHRQLSPEALQEVATARIYIAADAQKVGLVDRIGYLDDALQAARQLAALPDTAKVVIYRRTSFPDDNIYNPLSTGTEGKPPVLVDLGVLEWVPPQTAGFYYLWPAYAGGF